MHIAEAHLGAALGTAIVPRLSIGEHTGERLDRRRVVPLCHIDASQAAKRHRLADGVAQLPIQIAAAAVVGNRDRVVAEQIADVAGADQRGRRGGLIGQRRLECQRLAIVRQRHGVFSQRIADVAGADQRGGHRLGIVALALDCQPLLVDLERARKVALEVERVGQVLQHLPFDLAIADPLRHLERPFEHGLRFRVHGGCGSDRSNGARSRRPAGV